MKNIKNSNLALYCQFNNKIKVKKLLKEYSGYDLTESEGLCFSFAIKHNNAEMLGLLLRYYEDNVLKTQSDLPGYYKAKKKLQDILEDAIESFDISEEISHLLNRYIEMNSNGSDSDEEFDHEFSIIPGDFDFDDPLSYHTPDNSEHLDAAHFHQQYSMELLGSK